MIQLKKKTNITWMRMVTLAIVKCGDDDLVGMLTVVN